jgi:hypothetical protein
MVEQEDGAMTNPIRNRPSRKSPVPRAKPDRASPQSSPDEDDGNLPDPVDGANSPATPVDGTSQRTVGAVSN